LNILGQMLEFISLIRFNLNMKSESAIILSGIIMISSGFLLFYVMDNSLNLDNVVRYTKHAGIFVGLLGIGVTIAGILLRLTGRELPSIQENTDI